MTLAREAQELGRRGFRVHPLKSKSQPYTKYSETATSDPAAIAVLWQMFPQALIGICTGQGLVVIDDDRRTPEPDDGLKATLTARTANGGWHHYFYSHTPVRNSASKIAPGVDVRGEGGYVVAPPSAGYIWHNVPEMPPGKHYLLALPGVLLAACLRQEQSTAAGFEPRTHVPAGERHDYLVRFAGWCLANELDTEGPLDAFVLDHALEVCEPWPKSELASVARHVADICRWVIARESGRG